LRGAIALLIVGTVIVTLGAAAITVYAFRRRSRERFLILITSDHIPIVLTVGRLVGLLATCLAQ
jgi:hypothetical protein